jgi:hypothetical protein
MKKLLILMASAILLTGCDGSVESYNNTIQTPTTLTPKTLKECDSFLKFGDNYLRERGFPYNPPDISDGMVATAYYIRYNICRERFKETAE